MTIFLCIAGYLALGALTTFTLTFTDLFRDYWNEDGLMTKAGQDAAAGVFWPMFWVWGLLTLTFAIVARIPMMMFEKIATRGKK